MHTNEGTLRAYLDGELSQPACNAVAAHLRECKACRKQLEVLAARTSATSAHLQALVQRPRGAALPAPAPVALNRLHARLADERTNQPANEFGGIAAMFQRMFNRKYRVAWAGLATLVIVALLFTLAPVQAAASNFLGLFRVRKFAIVSIDPANLQHLDDIGGQIDKLLSDQVTFVKQPKEPVSVASAAEASQQAGIRVRLPAALAETPKLEVQDGMDAKLKVDVNRIHALLDVAGRSDIRLPSALDGANVEFIVPPMVMANYGSCSYGNNCVSLVQLASPTVDVPKGVDLAQMGEAMLQLLGLAPAEARHFARSIDWSSTLVIPMPTNAASFRDVTVDGVQGVLIESKAEHRGAGRVQYVLLWQKNDVVYGLTLWDDATRGLEIANSLK